MTHANIASVFVQFLTLVMVLTVSTPLVRVTALFKVENSPGEAADGDQKMSKRQVSLTDVMVFADGRLIDRLTPRCFATCEADCGTSPEAGSRNGFPPVAWWSTLAAGRKSLTRIHTESRVTLVPEPRSGVGHPELNCRITTAYVMMVPAICTWMLHDTC